MLQLSPEELPTFELAVVNAAKIHEEKSFRFNVGYTRVFHLADYSDKYTGFTVKYSDHSTIMRECEAIRRLHDLAAKDGSDDVPLVPEVAHYFRGLDGEGIWCFMGYIVMERILVREVSEEELAVAAAKAV